MYSIQFFLAGTKSGIKTRQGRVVGERKRGKAYCVGVYLGMCVYSVHSRIERGLGWVRSCMYGYGTVQVGR